MFYHLFFVFNDQDNYQKIYINGLNQDLESNTEYFLALDSRIILGASIIKSDNIFSGYIKNLLITPIGLNANQIYNIYNKMHLQI